MATTQKYKEDSEAARELAWRYFALHANQRLDVLKSYLTLMTITFAGFGPAFQIENYVLGIFLGIFSLILAVLFYFLDIRTRALIKTCEKYLKADEKILAGRLKDSRIKLFEISDRWSDKNSKSIFRISYGRILDAFFSLNALLSLAVTILFIRAQWC